MGRHDTVGGLGAGHVREVEVDRVPARLDGPGVPREPGAECEPDRVGNVGGGEDTGNPAASSRSRTVPPSIAVSAIPGQTALIWIPRRSSDGATLRTNPTTACFVAA